MNFNNPRSMMQALIVGETIISDGNNLAKLDDNGIFFENEKYFVPSVGSYSVWQVYTGLPACPFCSSAQLQHCKDSNNVDKSFVKCRTCKAQAPLKVWQKLEV